jgi:hypothetical protein
VGKKASMFEAANIREYRGHDVVDTQGHKIGELEAVYVDTGTDLPSFGTVKVGMPTRHRLVFVPLNRATVGPGYVKVSTARSRSRTPPRSGPMASCRWAAKRRSLNTTASHTSRVLAVSGSWPAAEQPNGAEDWMIAFFLLLVIAAMVLGIVGVVAKGLLYLLFIGIVVFLAALIFAALRMRRRPGRRPAR